MNTITCPKCRANSLHNTFWEVRYEHRSFATLDAVCERHYECYACGMRVEITTLESPDIFIDIKQIIEKDNNLWDAKQKQNS